MFGADVGTHKPSDALEPPVSVLFLCTGNSARSILSEALLNDLGQALAPGRFLAWSAGSHPSGQPHPDGLVELERNGHRTDLYRSKSWDEFTDIGVEMDIVVTVCDNAANEVCPVFSGAYLTVHWPAPDPAHIEPQAARQRAFADVYALCRARIETLIGLSNAELKNREVLQAIAQITS